MTWLFTLALFLSSPVFLFPQTIEEKKGALRSSQDSIPEKACSESLLTYHLELETIYKKAQELYERGAEERSYALLVEEAKSLKSLWNSQAAGLGRENLAVHAQSLWHMPETTVRQFLIDFGGSELIYLIPEEIAQRKVSFISTLCLPQPLWSDLVEIILSDMGIGVRQINPFCRELFLIGQSEAFEQIIDQRDRLFLVRDSTRVCYVVKSDQIDIKHLSKTLQRFLDPLSTQMKSFGQDLALIASASRVRQLLEIYDYLLLHKKEPSYRIVSINRLSAEDIGRMLSIVFCQTSDNNPKKPDLDSVGLQVFPIHYDQRAALFIAGTEKEVQRAIELVSDLEKQLEYSTGKRLFWYTAKHANVEDLAKVVAKVHGMLMKTNAEDSQEEVQPVKPSLSSQKKPHRSPGNIPRLLVKPHSVGYSEKQTDSSFEGDDHIVVDPKSGAIIMAVDPSLLPQLQQLLVRLDTPKKMVRIDFLLFEKKIKDQMQFGVDIARLGKSASGLDSNQGSYNQLGSSIRSPSTAGILSFFVSHKGSHGVPSFDLGYNFLLAQENVQINANPSVVTLNGTPSVVNLVDEISINTGPVKWEGSSQAGSLKDAYSRAQYGISIKVKPTIHSCDLPGQLRTITLDTDINFDTTRSNLDNRPNVSRRNIKNLVRIGEGQTIVIGGLRQKDSIDSQDAIPFLSEIPGFGKLFSYSATVDQTTEMFIFITPHIIDDPLEDFEKIQKLEMRARPGDIPEFLQAQMDSSKSRERSVLSRTLQTILGRFGQTSNESCFSGQPL